MEHSWDDAGMMALPLAGRLRLPPRLLRQDQALMRRIARWRAPRWLRAWMIQSSRGGDGVLWCVVGAGVLLFGGATRMAAFGCAALAAVLAVICFVGLKTWVRRPRPAVPDGFAHAHRARFWTRIAPSYSDEFSFPSGHSLTGFAVATSLMVFYPQFGLALLLCSASVAASRLVLGLHFLSDVVAGSMLGVALGYFSVYLIH